MKKFKNCWELYKELPEEYQLYIIKELLPLANKIASILVIVLSLIVEIYKALPSSLKEMVGVSILLLLIRSIIKHRNF